MSTWTASRALRCAGFWVVRVALLASGLGTPAWAQYQELEYEDRWNARTGQYESTWNPWNENVNNQRRWDMDRDYNDLVWRNQQSMADLNQWWDQREAERGGRPTGDRGSILSRLKARQAAGRARISSGKASTTFVPVPGFSVVTYLTEFRAKTPEAKRFAVELGAKLSQAYRAEIVARGLSPTDLADGYALDFVLAWEVWSGRPTTPAHLAFARKQVREMLLASVAFQGGESAERQKDFEYFGVLTMYARSIEGTDRAAARQAAEAILASVIDNSPEVIEMTPTGFAHRGEAIIAGGRATTTFAAKPSVGTAARYAQRFNSEYVAPEAATYQAQQKIDAFYRELASYGGRRNDLASIVALILAANVAVATGQTPTPVQIKSIEDLVRAAVLRSPNIQAASDANKQLACELLMIEAVDAVESKVAAMGASNVARIFKALEENPLDYELTPTGVVRVKGK